MSKDNFKQEHMMKVQGRDYLPVAPRVVMFRQENPGGSILTEVVELDGEVYVIAEVKAENGGLSRARKRVKKDARGPAKDWPVETAETGAIGRALALMGYGTLSGDLDEGDQLADAPVGNDVVNTPTSTEKSPPHQEAESVDTDEDRARVMIEVIRKKRNINTLNEVRDEARELAMALEPGNPLRLELIQTFRDKEQLLTQ